MSAGQEGSGPFRARDFFRARLRSAIERHRGAMQDLGILPLLRSAASLARPRWRKYLGSIIDPPGAQGTAVVRLDGMSIIVRPGEAVGHALAYDQFEPFERRLFASLVREDDTVFDVGANFGLYSVIASARLRSGSLWAFEPNPELFPTLKANLENRRGGRLEAHGLALGAVQGTVPFNCAVDSAFSSIVATGRVTTERTVEVPMTTIDAFMDEHEIARVDVMKIDVEGYELEVLQGARRLLARPDAPIVLIEVAQANLRPRNMTQGTVLGELIGHGYEVVVANDDLRPLSDQERCGGPVEAENFLAFKAQRRDRIGLLAGAS